MSELATELERLACGTARQQSACRILRELDLEVILRPYQSVLVGTLPLGISSADSDFDLNSRVLDFGSFERLLQKRFGCLESFSSRRRVIAGVESVMVSFVHAGSRVEIVGQAQPVWRQLAYLHRVSEERLLDLGGEKAREEILRLKDAGVKTEPAFASCFGLPGDPYEVLAMPWLARASLHLLRGSSADQEMEWVSGGVGALASPVRRSPPDGIASSLTSSSHVPRGEDRSYGRASTGTVVGPLASKIWTSEGGSCRPSPEEKEPMNEVSRK